MKSVLALAVLTAAPGTMAWSSLQMKAGGTFHTVYSVMEGIRALSLFQEHEGLSLSRRDLDSCLGLV